MDQILATIGDTIGDFFDSPVVQLGIRLIVRLPGRPLAGRVAYWAFRDMQQRSDNPILPYLAAAGIILFTPIFFILAVLGLQDHPAAREDRRGLGAEPGRGGAPRRGRVDPALPDLRAAGRRRMDHLPDLPDAAEPRLPELQPARRPRLVAVRVVRQGLRAPRAVAGHARAAPRRPRRDQPHRRPAGPFSRSVRPRPSRPGNRALRRPGPAAGALIPPDGESAPASATAPPDSPPAPAGSGGPLGTGTFTIEGRTAPALFVLGWLATLVGGGVLFVSLQTGAGAAKFVLFVVGHGAALAGAGLRSRLAGDRTASPRRPAVLGPVADPRVPRLHPDRRPPADPPRRSAPAGRRRHRRAAGRRSSRCSCRPPSTSG